MHGYPKFEKEGWVATIGGFLIFIGLIALAMYHPVENPSQENAPEYHFDDPR